MSSDFTVIRDEYMPLRELVFTTLRQAILKGELQPGERLMEIQLAEKMGVSRTPIREAIRKLAEEGLVTLIPRKGAVVAGISKKMLTDVLQVRMTLEKMAYECAFKNITAADLDRLSGMEKVFEEAVREGDLVRIAEADESFHFVIYDAADNDKLKELLNNLRENMYRYRMEYSKDIDTRKSLIEEHRQIFDSFVKGDFSRGLSVVERHIKNQETAVLNKLSQETF
ncbi:MAG: GntR family transcriptional regulator [Eubacteriales bacterium]|nr:GntR family transcriptional regulator [Eubacteriales bacterium]